MVVRKSPKSIVLPPVALSPVQTSTSTGSRSPLDDRQTPSLFNPGGPPTEYEHSRTTTPLRRERAQGSSILPNDTTLSSREERSRTSQEIGTGTGNSTVRGAEALSGRTPISQQSTFYTGSRTDWLTSSPDGDSMKHGSAVTMLEEGLENRSGIRSFSQQQPLLANNIEPPLEKTERHHPSNERAQPDVMPTRNITEDHDTNPFRSRIKGNLQSSREVALPTITQSRSLDPSYQSPDQDIARSWVAQTPANDLSSPESSALNHLPTREVMNDGEAKQLTDLSAKEAAKPVFQANQLLSFEQSYSNGPSTGSDVPSERDLRTRTPFTPIYCQDNARYQDQNLSRTTGISSPILPDIHKQLPMDPPVDERASVSLNVPGESLHLTTSAREGGSHQDSSLPTLEPTTRANVEVDILKLREQRNATYQIKHFTWFDHNSGTLRRSSMLIQNENGPCPLLALVNALILGVEDDTHSALGTALRTREQVSLGLIIETLMDELTSEGRGAQLTELPDVDELNQFLLMLHTGMTANPRLAAPTPQPNLMDARNSTLHLPLSLNDDRKPGGFEETQAMRLYGAFGIPLIHGWLATRSDPAKAAFSRSGLTYEDAQAVQFREEELETKLSQQGLMPGEQQLLQDISSIKTFLASHPTQITPYGLDIINESLFPGAFAILFRNDHFSTIYKQPETGQLFTLVTDAGYSDRDEVIWESLVDVSGHQNEFFSGDFRHVGNAETHLSEGRPTTDDTNLHLVRSAHEEHERSPMSPQDHQRLADADFAMALQLQEEEDARLEESRRPSGGVVQNRNTSSSSRGLNGQEGSRPSIPPRSSRNQGVSRPIDPNADEAPPPAYEEAAKVKPYIPPPHHPQHPSFSGRSRGSDPVTPRVISPRGGAPPPRRMSNLQHNSQYNGRPTLPPTNSGIIGQQQIRARDRDKDCIVM